MTDYDQGTDAYRQWSSSDNVYRLLEQTQYFRVLGSIQDLSILELACGDGRMSRQFMAQGARSVHGLDISEEMIKRAVSLNNDERGALVYPTLSFDVVDAGDDSFQLNNRVDVVTAMYLFHYAPSENALNRMCNLIGRNLKPRGRFVTYAINPDCDLSANSELLDECFGFYYRPIDPPHYDVVIGQFTANMWQWSREAHEEGLAQAGLTNIKWHPICLPENRHDLAQSLQWHLDNPSCIVLSAEKAS